MIENVIYSCREKIFVLLCNGIHRHVSVRQLFLWSAQSADQLTHHVTIHVISRVTTLTRKPFSMKCTPPSGRNLCDTARENTNIYETYHFPPRKSVKH